MVLILRITKTTSVWAVMNDKPEWEQQLNIYAWLVATNKKVAIKSLQIVAILKDWSKREAERKPEYPQRNVAMINIPLWTFEEQEAFIKGRIAKHSAAEFALETDADLPECTPQEMWKSHLYGQSLKLVIQGLNHFMKQLNLQILP